MIMYQKTTCFRLRVQRSLLYQRCRIHLLLAAVSAVALTMYIVSILDEPLRADEPSQRPDIFSQSQPSQLLSIIEATTEPPTLEQFFASHSFQPGNQVYNFSGSSWYDNSTTYSYDFNTYIEPQQSFTNLRYLFVVTTAVKYVKRRQVVRRTWSNHLRKYNDSKLVFLVGDPVDNDLQRFAFKEALEHDDMVQFSFTEHYENMTLKSIMMLKWAEQWQPTFLIKIDDDVMVNIKLFRDTIETLYSRLPEFIAGYGIFGKVPSRDENDKWFVPWSEYAETLFPDYVAGMLYVLPGNLASAFYAAALNTKPARFEDAYVAGLLATKLNVTRVGLPNMDIEGAVAECDMQDTLATHTQPKRMIKLFEVLDGAKTSCGKS